MFRKVTGTLGDVLTAAAAVWALAWKATRDRWGVVGLANAWAFWLLVAALPVGLLRLGRRSRWLGAGWLAAGLGLLAGRYTFAVPSGQSEADEPQGIALRLLSFNLLKENKNVEAAIAMFLQESPDIIALQELEPDVDSALAQRLSFQYPYRHYAPHPAPGGGLGIYARLPFDIYGILPSDGRRPYALCATFDLPEGSFDVYNIHLLPTAGQTLIKMGASANFRLRTDQARRLVDEMRRAGRPALALGDYNLTEGSEGYRVLRSGLTDAWRIAGKGPGWTWPRSLAPHRDMAAQPLLRIDYCFCTADIRPQRMRVVRDLLGSDHCPLVIDARIAPPENGRAIAAAWPVWQTSQVEVG